MTNPLALTATQVAPHPNSSLNPPREAALPLARATRRLASWPTPAAAALEAEVAVVVVGANPAAPHADPQGIMHRLILSTRRNSTPLPTSSSTRWKSATRSTPDDKPRMLATPPLLLATLTTPWLRATLNHPVGRVKLVPNNPSTDSATTPGYCFQPGPFLFSSSLHFPSAFLPPLRTRPLCLPPTLHTHRQPATHPSTPRRRPHLYPPFGRPIYTFKATRHYAPAAPESIWPRRLPPISET
jgi:hypothetical protein